MEVIPVVPNISIELVLPKEEALHSASSTHISPPSPETTPPTNTLHGCDIEQVKARFISALLNKDEENALLWGYELYYSDLKFEAFYILNELYQLFYIDKHHYYFNGYLQVLAKEWEATKRKNATILGTIIKSLVHLDISITEMVNNKTPNPNIWNVLKYDLGFPDIEDLTQLAGDPTEFKTMTIEELTKLKRKLKKLETKPKTKTVLPEKIQIPFYLCELFEIGVDPETFIYASFEDWCNIHTKTSATKTVILRRRKRGGGAGSA
jgi:hypothetical protein